MERHCSSILGCLALSTHIRLSAGLMSNHPRVTQTTVTSNFAQNLRVGW